MKNTKVFSLLAAFTGVLAFPGLSFGLGSGDNWSGSVAGWVETLGYVVNADIAVDFTDAASGDITVSVTNTGPTSSRITSFFLLLPWDGGGAVDDTGLSLTNTGAYGGGSVLDPNDWYVADTSTSDFTQSSNYGGYEADGADYFGGTVNVPGSGTPEGTSIWYPTDPTSGVFTFHFGEDLSNYSWFTEDAPMVYVRWQTVDGSRSAKGYGGGDKWVRPEVPEPSAIALMAVAGLGGLLLLRRRLTRKK